MSCSRFLFAQHVGLKETSLLSWQICPLLFVHEQLVWEEMNTLSLRNVDSLSIWGQSIVIEKQRNHWRTLCINNCYALIVYFQLKQDLCKRRIDERYAEFFSSGGFLHLLFSCLRLFCIFTKRNVFFRFSLWWLETERNEGIIDHITGWMSCLLFILVHSLTSSVSLTDYYGNIIYLYLPY